MNSQIGDGFSSVIRLSEYNGQRVAIKIFKEFYSQKLREKEIKILKSLDHKNIVKLIDHELNYKYFICEEMKQDLFTLLKKGKKLNVSTVKQILLELSETLSHLHNLNYVHRDIKLENIMINDKCEIKLIDFGFAEYIDTNKMFNRFCGTLNYMAPELLSSEKQLTGQQLKKCDVFALGVVIFTLLYGFPPYNPEIGAKIECKFWRAIQDKKFELYWKCMNKSNNVDDLQFQQLFEKMISSDPQERCDIQYVLNHPWLDGKHDLNQLKQLIQ